MAKKLFANCIKGANCSPELTSEINALHSKFKNEVDNQQEAKVSTIQSLLDQKRKDLAAVEQQITKALKAPQTKDEKLQQVGSAQRGAPERAMLKVQRANGGGVLNPVVEHLGDLTHRMTLGDRQYAGYEYVKEKVEKGLRALQSSYGFNKERLENLKSNASYNKVSLEEQTAKVDAALKQYAAEHKKIPVYNEAQRVARQVAIDIGNKEWASAISNLKTLQEHLDTPQKWVEYAHQDLGESAKNSERTTTTGGMLSVKGVESEVRAFLGNGFNKLKKMGKIDIVATMGELKGTPLYSRTGQVAGMYYEGKITLIAENNSEGDIAYLMRHEGLHMLMAEDEVFKKQFSAILNDFAANRGDRGAVDEAYSYVPNDTAAEHVDEEAMAYLLQNPKNHTHNIVKRMIANVKAWLMRHGISFKKMSTADLIAFVDQNLKSFANRSAKSRQQDFNPTEFYEGAASQKFSEGMVNLSPITVSLFESPMLQNKSGAYVKTGTINQILAGKGVKAIEKEIINEVLNQDGFKGQKSIPYDAFRLAVERELMPLEKIETGKWSDYGASNLGFKYDNAVSVVYNSPIEHGIGDHFDQIFDTRAVDNQKIEYEVVEVPDRPGLFVALDANRPAFQATEEDAAAMQEYVGTAGSEEQVRGWVEQYNNDTGESSRRAQAGVFGHVRRWDAGNSRYLPEVQSDFYQKNKPEEGIVKYIINTKKSLPKEQTDLVEEYDDLDLRIFDTESNVRDTLSSIKKVESKIAIFQARKDAAEKRVQELKNKDTSAMEGIESDLTRHRNAITMAEYDVTLEDDAISDQKDLLKTFEDRVEFKDGRVAKLRQLEKEMAAVKKRMVKSFTLEQKQFVAHRKNYTERLLKEEIRIAAKEGKESLLIPAERCGY